MASTWFLKAGTEIGKGNIDLETADIRVMILQSSYALDQTKANTHEFVADLVASEVSGSTRSGTIANRAWTEDALNNWVSLGHDPTTHGSPAAGETIGYAVLFVHNADDALARLLLIDDAPDQATAGTLVTYNPPANGHVFLRTPPSP